MTLIFVAGMHRSGTSFATEVIRSMGAATGDNTLKAANDNPFGFFERPGVVKINDAVLGLLGASWDRPPIGLTSTWAQGPAFDALRRRAAAELESLMSEESAAPAVVVKDPRLCLTAPFWNSLVDVDASVMLIRRPSEVAQSLRRRNGMSPTRAARLWVRYTLDALVTLPSPLIVPFRDLVTGRVETIEQLAHATGLGSGVDNARALIKDRSEAWQPAATSSLAIDDDDAVQTAQALFSLLIAQPTPSAIRPLIAEFAEANEAAALLRVDDLLHQEPDATMRSALQRANNRVSKLRSDVESERLAGDELRRERDSARRAARGFKQELAETKATAAQDAADAERKIDEIAAALNDAGQALASKQRELDRAFEARNEGVVSQVPRSAS